MDLSLVGKKIKEGVWIHRPNESTKSTGRFWKTCDRIVDPEKNEIITDCVICRMCKKVFRYDSKKGI